MEAPGSTVTQLLLQEAQTEIANLRTDLYNTRRVAEERRQNELGLQRANEALTAQVGQLEAHVRELQGQVSHAAQVQAQLEQLQQEHTQLQRDFDVGQRARRILESELAQERKQRGVVEEAKASLEAERARLTKSRDDLAASLRVAQRKVEEAEEEQVRAEEEAAALRQEVKALHQAHAGSAMYEGHEPANNYSASQHSQHYDMQSQQEHQHILEQRLLTVVAEAEQERTKASALLASLQDASTEKWHLQQRIDSLEAMNSQLQQEVHELERQVQQVQHQSHPSQQPSQHAQHPTSQPPPQAGSGEQAQADEVHAALNQHEPSTSALPSRSSVPEGSGGSQSAAAALVLHQRHTSSSTGSEEFADEVKSLHAQAAKLKASRDKLLEQIDRQWEEMDRLAADNRQLSEETERLKHVAHCWEVQAQGSLAAEERLKEMLEEAASFSVASPAGGQDTGRAGKAAADIEAALLGERAKAAELELQVRALVGELLRSRQASMAIGRAVLPALSSIEHKLTGMHKQAGLSSPSTRSSIQDAGRRLLSPGPSQALQVV